MSDNAQSAHPALALLEFSSIALGARTADAIAKKAPVTLIRAGTVQPGRFVILFSGDVASVEESVTEGLRVGEAAMLDYAMLPDVHPDVKGAMLGALGVWGDDAIGIIETPTLGAILRAADAAMKGAEVGLVEIRLADGLGGKGLAILSGTVANVQAAIEIGTEAIADRPQPPQTTIIPRFDAGVRAQLEGSSRFGPGW